VNELGSEAVPPPRPVFVTATACAPAVAPAPITMDAVMCVELSTVTEVTAIPVSPRLTVLTPPMKLVRRFREPTRKAAFHPRRNIVDRRKRINNRECPLQCVRPPSRACLHAVHHDDILGPVAAAARIVMPAVNWFTLSTVDALILIPAPRFSTDTPP